MTRHCRIIEHGKFSFITLSMKMPLLMKRRFYIEHYLIFILISRKHTLKG